PYRGAALSGAVHRSIDDIGLEKCEAACREEDACLAFTYHKAGRVCRLFDSANEYTARTDSDNGAKVQEVQAASAASTEQPKSVCTSVAGQWRWFNGSIVGINANGTTMPSPDGITGRWNCHDGTYVFVWSHGYTDRLTLSADGRRLSGKNN